MKLLELEPKWLTPNLFVFRCPHCRHDWLTCKNVVISTQDQFDIFEKEFGDSWNAIVVGADPPCCWSIQGSFENLTVTPSLDASKSGHWHGYITGGEIK